MAENNEKEVGKLDEAEMQAFSNLKSTEQELTYRVGQYFRELLSQAAQANDVNRRAFEMAQKFRERFDIPLNQNIRIDNNGTVFVAVEEDPVEEEGGEQ